MIGSTGLNSEVTAGLKILSVHNQICEENIPIENFLRLDKTEFSLHVLSLFQSESVAGEFIRRTYPESRPAIHGLNWRRHPPCSLWRLLQTFRTVHPHIVHLNHGFSGFLGGLLARCMPRTRVVTTLHGNFRSYPVRQKVLLLSAMWFSHLICCNSESTLRSLGRWKQTLLRKKAFRVCYNGVNRDKVAAAVREVTKTTQQANAEPLCIGFVGRLVWQKDVPTLLNGFAKFHQQRPNSRLLLAGDGPLLEDLKMLAKTLRIDDAVEFKGALSRQEVYRMLAQVDAVVISSRWEGFCNAMVEAMFAGKAIVATNIEVLPEVLGSDCGLFFEVGQDDDLAEHLLALHDDDALRARLGESALQRAESNFSIDACARRYSNSYHEIIGTATVTRKAT